MATQAIQKSYRLPLGTSALGILILLCASCARDLKSDNDLSLAPEDFEQKIVAVDLEALSKKQAEAEAAKAKIQSRKKTSPKAAASPAKQASSTAAAPSVATAPKAAEPAAVETRKWPMSIGERSSYNLRWGVIEAGVVSMEVKPPQNIEGVTAMHYTASVRSSKMMELFYKIEDSIDTWVRLSDLAPIRQEIKQNESARWGRRVLVIAPEKNEVKFYEHLTKSNGQVNETRRTDTMTPGAQDIFGALYFYRFIAKQEGAYKFPIHDKGKNWFAELRYDGKESLRVPAGLFAARRFKVLPRLEGQLEPKGDVMVWVTDDDRSLMLKFNAKIKVGSVTGELTEHTAGKKIELAMPKPLTPIENIPTADAKE